MHYISTASYSIQRWCCKSNSDSSAVNYIFGQYENNFNFILELLRISQCEDLEIHYDVIKSKNDHLMQVSSHPVFGGCILKKFGSLNYNFKNVNSLTEVVLLL